MNNLDQLPNNQHVVPMDTGIQVLNLVTPNGASFLLTAGQVMSATIAASPNTGRTYVTVPILVRIEVNDTPDGVRERIALGVCRALEKRVAMVEDLSQRLDAVTRERDTLAADARARSVEKAALDAVAGRKS
jgi:hypothetical protein